MRIESERSNKPYKTHQQQKTKSSKPTAQTDLDASRSYVGTGGQQITEERKESKKEITEEIKEEGPVLGHREQKPSAPNVYKKEEVDDDVDDAEFNDSQVNLDEGDISARGPTIHED